MIKPQNLHIVFKNIVVCSICLSSFLLFVSCKSNRVENSQDLPPTIVSTPTSPKKDNLHAPQQAMGTNMADKRDNFYKMFYGKWKINKIEAVGSRWGAPDSAKELIGQTIEYSFDNIKINDVIKVYKPIYSTILSPVTPDFRLVEYLPTLGELGISGNYFAAIYIENCLDVENLIGSKFCIKDDSTLLMFEPGVCYELKRISGITDPVIAFPG